MARTGVASSKRPRDKYGRWRQGWIDLVIESPPFRLILLLIELLSFVAAAIGIWFAYLALDATNQARIDQRVSEARMQLMNPPRGLYDVGEDVRAIINNGRPFAGILLGCDGPYNPMYSPDNRCEGGPYLTDLVARGTDRLRDTAISRSLFRGVVVGASRFERVRLDDTVFAHSDLYDVAFADCLMSYVQFIDVGFSRTSFTGCRLENASFDSSDLRGIDFSGVELDEVNISGAVLCDLSACVANLPRNGVYYYSDRAPVIANDDLFPTLAECEPPPPGDLSEKDRYCISVRVRPAADSTVSGAIGDLMN